MRISKYEDPKVKRNKEIVKLAQEGIPYEEIAQKFNLTRSTISHIAIKNGVIRRPQDIGQEKWAGKMVKS